MLEIHDGQSTSFHAKLLQINASYHESPYRIENEKVCEESIYDEIVLGTKEHVPPKTAWVEKAYSINEFLNGHGTSGSLVALL